GLCLGRQGFGKPRGRVPEFAERDIDAAAADGDASSLPAGHPLEPLDDRLLEILVAKARKRSGRWSVPVQRTRIGREPGTGWNRLDGVGRRIGARVASQGMQGLSCIEDLKPET